MSVIVVHVTAKGGDVTTWLMHGLVVATQAGKDLLVGMVGGARHVNNAHFGRLGHILLCFGSGTFSLTNTLSPEQNGCHIADYTFNFVFIEERFSNLWCKIVRALFRNFSYIIFTHSF